jgi:UDPglucose 6-dehydrogenase
MIKYVRNCFLALKVSFCNEIEEYCTKKEINYENVRNLAMMDNRIGSSHSVVPGHDGSRGYGGTCFPKDMNALTTEMEKIGMKSYILRNSIIRNEEHDRSKKDWFANKGRSVVDNQ